MNWIPTTMRKTLTAFTPFLPSSHPSKHLCVNPWLNMPLSSNPIQSYHIACSHHSSDITRIELMVSKVGSPSVVSQTGRNLISPCQCWFSCLMKAKLRLSQPVIKSRFFSGKIWLYVTCMQNLLFSQNHSIWPVKYSPLFMRWDSDVTTRLQIKWTIHTVACWLYLQCNPTN